MRWEVKDYYPGDIIRVKLGSVYHYGIFVSEDEVIQFGYPPLDIYQDKEKVVVATDIDTFACSQLIEVGSFVFSDHKKRFRPELTIESARKRIGEGGYDMLTNNCEHFAFECYSGRHYSSQEEDMRKKWEKL